LKVTAAHLGRAAYLYVRQSTVRQVFENTESTKRQYALRDRALALGWEAESIQVIDSDLGQSGVSSHEREGFRKLVAEVGLGRAGIVMGLEVSRLARNSADWHRLIEICALTDTLILDEDGIYDPADFNDRLLLGLKGTMSEAEIHFMGARLRGGILNKARRGELRTILPVGFVYDTDHRIVLDPDQQVQAAIRLLFQTFLRTGTATATAKYFRDQKLLFPRASRKPSANAGVVWGPLCVRRVLWVLRNPRYAGAYFYGRYRCRKMPEGRAKRVLLPPDQWNTLIRDAHAGYISWEQQQSMQEQLRRTAQAFGADRHHSPPREGPALLQGRVICGLCGNRMSVRYRSYRRRIVTEYRCAPAHLQGDPACQVVIGTSVDAAVGALLVEAMTPMAVQVALAVQQEIEARLQEAEQLRRQQVERARYQAEAARQRYLLVDPLNRLVARSLEADWNEKLRALAEAQDSYDHERQLDQQVLSESRRQQLCSLVKDFRAVWNDPATPHRERKRMLGLLVEDVTLIKDTEIKVHVRFRGGATTTLKLPLPLNAWQMLKTPDQVLAQIDALLEHHTEAETVAILNERGLRTGAGKPFTMTSLRWVQYARGAKSHKQHLQAAGLLTTKEMASKLGKSEKVVRTWRREGILQACRCSDQHEWLYYPPDGQMNTGKTGREIIQPASNQEGSDATTAGGVV
jgi:DNA invertase Pin-like site-specific DNA recombinase